MRNSFKRPAGARRAAFALSAILLCTCTGDNHVTRATTTDAPTLSAGDSPLLEIKDGRNAGPAGFYFLTPIAPALTSYPRPFDGARSPVVEICIWTGTACQTPLVARYTSVPANMPGQYYRIDWPTTGLSPANVYRIRVLEGSAERGHADAKIVVPPQTAASVTAQGYVPLGNSSLFPIRFRLETNQPPVVTITSPANGAVVPFGTTISFTGTATDPEDGDIGNRIIWRSNRVSGDLGTGKTLPVDLPGGTHTITASVTDVNGATTTASIQVAVNLLSIPPTLNVPYGGTASLPIILSSAAPTGGVTFDVKSDNTALVGVTTPTVPVSAGAVAANATLAGTFPGTATVTVSSDSYGIATSQVSTTAALNITQSSVTFSTGAPQQITVQLESAGLPIAAPAGGISVTMTSADPSCVVPVSPITIPAGLVNTTAALSYGGTAAVPCHTSVTASVPSIPQITTDNIVVTEQTPPPVLSITQFGGNRVGAGLRINGVTHVTLGAPAPAGGVDVKLTSATPSTGLAAPASPVGTVSSTAPTVNVAAGGTGADFIIDGVEGAAGVVTFTATASGYTDATTTVTVAPLAVRFNQPPPSTTTSLSLNSPMRAEIGALDAAGTAMGPVQTIRPGGTPVTITFSNTNSLVARLATTAATGQSVTATIGVGASQTPTTLAAGGVELDPMNGGSTTVSVGGAGLIQVPTFSQDVSVTGAALSITQFGGSRVGAGLRIGGATRVTLGAPAPAGGVDVTLTSGTPTAALTAPASPSGTIATTSATVNVAGGGTTADFIIDGAEGGNGTVTFTASATGFTDGTTSIIVTPVAVRLAVAPPSSTTSSSLNSAMRAEVGVLNATGTGIAGAQVIRPGGTALSVTFSNSNAAVAQLVTTALTAQSVSATIAVGASQTPTTVAAGGVEFDPIAGGITTVSIGGTGLTPVTPSSQDVTITGAALSITQFGSDRIGAGLRNNGTTRVTLGAPAPAGGVDVKLTSGTPATALAAPASPAGTVSTSAAVVSVPAGGTTADFILDGVEGANGAVTFTATAPGYSDASVTITVTNVALQFNSSIGSTTSLSNNSPLRAQIGARNAAGTGFGLAQAIRPGGTPVVVTFSNSDNTVAQLVTTATTAQTVTATIDVGSSITPATVASGGVEFDPLGGGTTTLSLSTAGVTPVPTSSQVVSVDAPGITITEFGGARIGAGLRQGSVTRVNLGAPAPTGGVLVTLQTSSAAVSLAAPASPSGTIATAVPSVMVAAGGTAADFVIDGVEGATGTVTYTAKAAGFTDGTTTITITNVGVNFSAPPPATTTSLSANSSVRAQIGAINAAGTGLSAPQVIRPGGTAIVINFSNSNPATAQLVTSAVTGQTVTATIAVGASTTAIALADGGVQFDPLAVGTTTVSVSGSGLTSVATSSTLVTVSAPALTITQFGGTTVGAGLRQGNITRVSLGAPAPAGGVVITLTSGTPLAALAAPSSPASTVATAAPTVTVAAGNSTADFVVDGIEGASGDVTFTATASVADYTTDAATVTVTGVGVNFLSVLTTTTAGAANSVIRAQVGSLNAAGTALASVQTIRPGGSAIVLTFSNSNAAAAQLVTTGTTDQTATATIAVGASASASTVAGGGVAFDPLAAGTTTVSVSGAGLTPVPTSSKVVTVN